MEKQIKVTFTTNVHMASSNDINISHTQWPTHEKIKSNKTMPSNDLYIDNIM
jgi:hypothetical protein